MGSDNVRGNLYIISDLHIWGADDPLYRSLLSLVRQRAQPGDTLVLAGDLFDVFIGSKEIFRSQYAAFIDGVKYAAANGVRVHYIEGNHDFLMKNVFASATGVFHHDKSVSIEMAGKRFFLAHGDLVDSKDYAYRALRSFLRSPPLRAAVVVFPGKVVQGIARRSSQYSRERVPRIPTELPIERRERLRTVYRSYAAERVAEGYDFVVMGHCHDLDEKTFQIGGRIGQYINVGYPRAHGSFLSWSPGEVRISREKLPG